MEYGVDRIGQHAGLLNGRVALATSPSGRTSGLQSTIERLREVCSLQLLLAPEHGVRGDKGAGETFENAVDGPSGLPVASLYGKDASHHLSEEVCAAFDILVYDIQDVGARCYTFISTLQILLEDCARYGKRLIVLDRPNPLGDMAEGMLLRPDTRSFVGCYDIPLRYGLTCGEFALMVNHERDLGCDLQVIPCLGWNRHALFPELNKVWVMPSLAMPRFETALLYPGTCMLEGVNCSEGRGTADPFAILGAPYIDAETLTARFNAMKLPGVIATPLYFTPSASKYAGEMCGGMHLHVTDAHRVQPVALGMQLLALIRELYPKHFSLLPPLREGDMPFLSKLAGHRLFENADWPVEDWLSCAEREAAAFAARKQAYHLY